MHADHLIDNRLALASSPYLLQHAKNPVDWRVWGDACIAEARSRGVPLFVSIGYSTCYWCHVMERESFEDPRVGALLREAFVSVKVDREERPDVDEWIMTACQTFTELTEGRASGGWPLNAFVDPHTRRAFYAGTYFPPTDAHGRPSFTRVVQSLAQAWRERHDVVVAQANQLGELAERVMTAKADFVPLAEGLPQHTASAVMRMVDATHGGFGGAPKFPQPPLLRVLLEASVESPSIAPVVDAALRAMVTGGLFDQVGGGFRRYCVDANWTVPHFEKMLYDNGQLLEVLARHHARSPSALWEHAMRRTAAWMERELAAPDGCWHAALDAEVDGREGAFDVWSVDGARAALNALTEQERAHAIASLGLDRPNFTDPHHPDAPAQCVPTRRPWTLDAVVDRACDLLRQARDARPHPRRDDKVILEWNGLAIEGLAQAGAALKDQGMVDRAARAARAIIESMSADGCWYRIRTGGVSSVPATLADIACFGLGCMALFRATGSSEWLDHAAELAAYARSHCSEDGWWYATAAGSTDLPCRARAHQDGATPSGLSTIIDLDAHLATGSSHAAEAARASLIRTLSAESGTIMSNPVGLAWSVAVLQRAVRDGLIAWSAGTPTVDGRAQRIVCGPDGCSLQ